VERDRVWRNQKIAEVVRDWGYSQKEIADYFFSGSKFLESYPKKGILPILAEPVGHVSSLLGFLMGA